MKIWIRWRDNGGIYHKISRDLDDGILTIRDLIQKGMKVHAKAQGVHKKMQLGEPDFKTAYEMIQLGIESKMHEKEH